MRHVWLCAVLCALSATPAIPSSIVSPHPGSVPPLTIVLDFRGPYADESVLQMEREVENLLRGVGRPIEWRSWEEATHLVFDEIAVVRFRGDCEAQFWPNGVAPEGALGSTHISDGVVLPFSDIACDRIATSIRSAILGMEHAQADMIFGRALGRVVAHELMHIMSRSTVHGHEGIAQSALSRSELTDDKLDLSPKDLLRMTGKDNH
jgi:hypothetical protein